MNLLLHRSVRRWATLGMAAACAVSLAGVTVSTPARAEPAATGIIRVYNNNIENLVYNKKDQKNFSPCLDISATQHWSSMLVDDAGKTISQGGKPQPPDILTFQQVRGKDQTLAYAKQLTNYFASQSYVPRKPTYAMAIIAWDDPEKWGLTHDCTDETLGDKKNKQTNTIIYNINTLHLVGTTTRYWSAGWSPSGGESISTCRVYKKDVGNTETSFDANGSAKWKRTSAVAARFTVLNNPAVVVWAASMHLPQENHQPILKSKQPDLTANNACAGYQDRGEHNTGVHVGDEAHDLMVGSTIRVVGMDANRMKLPTNTLDRYNMTNVGSGNTHQATFGGEKIDYLFVKGPKVLPSPIGNTVAATQSPHKALYAFIIY